MIYLLAVVLLLILLLTYNGVKKDLMHPSVLIVSSMLMSTVAAMYNVDLWGIQLHFNTVVIVVSSMLCIAATGFFTYNVEMNESRKAWITNKNREELKNIQVDSVVFFLVICFNLFVVVWYYYIIVKITGGGALKEMIASFRMIHSYGVASATDVSMPAMLNQCIKLNKVLAYLFIMIFFNNIYATGQKDWRFLLPPFLFCVQTLLGSDRIYIVCFVGASIVMAYIMWHRKNGWISDYNKKYVSIIVKAMILLLVFFFFSRNFVGHSKNEISNPLEYITQYIGGSIQLLDMFIQEPMIPEDAGWGEESFSSIYKTIIQSQGIIPPKRHMEFRSSNGIIIGNIYTAIRKYYFDFGFCGVIIMSCLLGLILGFLYRKLQQEKVCNILASYKLCSYCFMIHVAFYFSLDDLFFSGILSVNYLTMFIYMWVVYYFLIKKPVRF